MSVTLQQVADFVTDHYPPADDWGEDLTMRWLDAMAEEGFIQLTLAGQSDLRGIVVARPVMYAMQATEDVYAFDQEGSVIFLDLCIAVVPRVKKALGFAVLTRFGEREHIAYQRYPSEEIRIWPFEQFRRNILRREQVLTNQGH